MLHALSMIVCNVLLERPDGMDFIPAIHFDSPLCD